MGQSAVATAISTTNFEDRGSSLKTNFYGQNSTKCGEGSEYTFEKLEQNGLPEPDKLIWTI